METLMKAFSELEKLKEFLFDEDQLCLFEHIPKPFLMDGNVANLYQEKDGRVLKKRDKMADDEIPSKKELNKHPDTENDPDSDPDNIIITDPNFWKKETNFDVKLNKLTRSYFKIKERYNQEQSPFDKKLLKMLNKFKPNAIPE